MFASFERGFDEGALREDGQGDDYGADVAVEEEVGVAAALGGGFVAVPVDLCVEVGGEEGGGGEGAGVDCFQGKVFAGEYGGL